MFKRLILLCLPWLVMAACTPTPETVATISATRPIASNTPFPTSIPANTASSDAAVTLSSADVPATKTAFTVEPTPEPPLPTIHTPIPQPTFTPYPGPTWRILFHAVSCPTTNSSCGNDLFMTQEPQWYLVESDGSGLIALEDTGTFLVDMWGYPYLSPDGTQLAYLARSDVDDELHIMLAEVHNGNVIDLGLLPGVFHALRFLSEPGCLAIYTSPGLDEMPSVETLTITKVCALIAPQIIETIEFPDLQLAFNQYRLSPKGDALLITTRNASGIPEIYVYEFGSQQPPHNLFSAEDETWFLGGPIRWQPDGQKIDFFVQHLEPDGLMQVLVYTSDRLGTHSDNTLGLKLPFSVTGDWSPDGREIAFIPGMPEYTPETSGIYILNLENGEWRQILSGFYADAPLIQDWQANLP